MASVTPTVRDARPSDARDLARAWIDAGRYYAALDPRRFQVPYETGLVDWLARALARPREENEIWLVVEIGERIVGDVVASLAAPAADAEYQLMRDVGETVLRIDAVAIAEADRRRGAGTELMRAAEAWGRERGASRVFLTTDLRSDLSIPFYERLGFERVSVGFWKSL